MEHAGEVLTVQRAAYVTEAQRYDAPHIAALCETFDEVRGDLGVDSRHLVVRAAWLGPRLVGSVRGRIDGDRMEVARFTVAPDLQRRGIGRALLAAVHAAAPEHVAVCWLITGARSTGNLALYAAAGYRPVGGGVDDAGVELVRMERERGSTPDVSARSEHGPSTGPVER